MTAIPINHIPSHPEQDTTPEAAYYLAPPVIDEAAWARATATAPDYDPTRTDLLRRAALWDRIALACPEHTETADTAALLLIDTDRDTTGADTDARAYVRREYARWATFAPDGFFGRASARQDCKGATR
ncbi:hypothetical protein ACIPX0_26015 [Streptomyces sp. NPDC090075]|uniref:hypothetical protein n=1 Tax=Streptomyces sp. NPDC090075 TaxID=3365937 RepID=UPI0038035312